MSSDRRLVPAWKSNLKLRVWPADIEVAELASHIVERAWRGPGVRVFRWPCGACLVVRVDSREDRVLQRDCMPCLFMTATRGVELSDVLADLRWAKRHRS